MAKRVATGSTLGAISFVILLYSYTFIGSIFFLILVNLMVAGGLYEFYSILEKKGSTSLMAYGMVSGVTYCTISFFTSENPIATFHPDFFNVTLVAIIIGFFVLQFLRKDSSSVIYNFGGTIAGMFYVAWLLAFAAKISYFPKAEHHGAWYLLMLVGVVKIGDSAAYFCGYKFGRTKLCPKTSPKKTVEGCIAHLIVGTIVAIVFKFAVLSEITLAQAVIVGASLSVIGQFGDLAESLVKRDANVKDAGGYFRELGGVLDVIDSILFALPLLYYMMRFWLLRNG
jgi:phosphatidate cytidylyltransferase